MIGEESELLSSKPLAPPSSFISDVDGLCVLKPFLFIYFAKLSMVCACDGACN